MLLSNGLKEKCVVQLTLASWEASKSILSATAFGFSIIIVVCAGYGKMKWTCV